MLYKLEVCFRLASIILIFLLFAHLSLCVGVDVPQARTPWDLDPFGQQQNPSYMNDPGVSRTPSGDRQVMLMTLYQVFHCFRRTLRYPNLLHSQPSNKSSCQVLPIIYASS